MIKRSIFINFFILFFALVSKGQNNNYVMLEEEAFRPLMEFDFNMDNWTIVNGNLEGKTEIIFNNDSILNLYKNTVVITPIRLINSHSSPQHFLQIIKNNECIKTITYYLPQQLELGSLKNHFVNAKEKKSLKKLLMNFI